MHILSEGRLSTDQIGILYKNISLPKDDIFHKPAYINMMIKRVRTLIAINHSVDTILPIQAYTSASTQIAQRNADFIYPYSSGKTMKRVDTGIKDQLMDLNSIYTVMDSNHTLDESEYRDIQFFNTISYIKGGMENELFKSSFYDFADKERYHRFCKLGYTVGHLNDTCMYHLEHEKTVRRSTSPSRLVDSSHTDIYSDHDMKCFRLIDEMTQYDLHHYFNGQVQKHSQEVTNRWRPVLHG